MLLTVLKYARSWICRYGLNECWGARKERWRERRPVSWLNIRLENRFGERVAVALGCVKSGEIAATHMKESPHSPCIECPQLKQKQLSLQRTQ